MCETLFSISSVIFFVNSEQERAKNVENNQMLLPGGYAIFIHRKSYEKSGNE